MIRVHVRSKGQGRPYLLYYIDPATKREKSKSAGTKDRMEAERAAAEWERELRAFRGDDDCGWDYFMLRFESEHLADKAKNTGDAYRTALRAFRDFSKVGGIGDVTTSLASQWKAAILESGKPVATAANYLTHLRAAVNWAKSIGMIATAPKIPVPSAGTQSQMRGRPLTEEEFKKLLAGCSKFPYPAEWKRLLELLWLSGLRLGEALALTWGDSYPLVEMDAKPYPLIIFSPASHKSRKDDAVTVPPDLFEWLKRTPPAKRKGRVASAPNKLGVNMPLDKASDRISQIGVLAHVSTGDGKYATAHDLRRSFGTRWAAKVSPHSLQQMMRHKSFTTTMRFYIQLRSTAAGAEMYESSQTFPAKLPKRSASSKNAARKQPNKRGKKWQD